MRDAPQLLVEWEPGWRSFAGSLVAALRPQPRGAGFIGIPYGVRPRGPLGSLLLHGAIVFAYISLSPWFHVLAPSYPHTEAELSPHTYDGPIYYLSEGLPVVADVGGAERGRMGKSGGSEAFHPKQVIRIVRGNKLVRVMVDAPNLSLPRTDGAVANLFALSSPLPPPPAHALPNVLRMRKALPQVVAVVPPAPEVTRSNSIKAPDLAAEVIPPSASARELPGHTRLMLPPVEAVPPTPGVPATVLRSNVALPVLPSVNVNLDRSAGMTDSQGMVSSSGSTSAGSGTPAALIITVEPGDMIGNPAGEPGSLAKSPSGAGSGFGGSGTGGGIGKGAGPGSGPAGTGPGSGNSGTGLASGSNSGGVSSAAGPGGAGNGAPGAPMIAGASISGGAVHLPSFGTTPGAPALPRATARDRRRPPGVVVIASPRAVSTLGNVGKLRGDRVYTIYLDTRVGTAVMEFSDPSTREKFEQDLTAPEPLLVDVPAEMKIAQTLAACVLDRSGALRNIRILRTATPEIVARLVSVLEKWRFRPAFRGSNPIEVETLLGFGIDTR